MDGLDETIKKLQGRCIGPVDVFPEHEDRLALSQSAELADKGRECQVFAPLRTQVDTVWSPEVTRAAQRLRRAQAAEASHWPGRH